MYLFLFFSVFLYFIFSGFKLSTFPRHHISILSLYWFKWTQMFLLLPNPLRIYIRIPFSHSIRYYVSSSSNYLLIFLTIPTLHFRFIFAMNTQQYNQTNYLKLFILLFLCCSYPFLYLCWLIISTHYYLHPFRSLICISHPSAYLMLSPNSHFPL